ncbi:MAG: hypothetical protein ACP5OG_04350 [Candidatus Nanoarchaeia archaeon]
MNKKITIGIIICFLLIIAMGIFLAFPKIKESNIKSAMEKANYCELDSDCVNAGGKCPFGCYAYVNKNEVEKISKLISSYNSKCVYGCLLCPSAVCENKKCKEVCI